MAVDYLGDTHAVVKKLERVLSNINSEQVRGLFLVSCWVLIVIYYCFKICLGLIRRFCEKINSCKNSTQQE